MGNLYILIRSVIHHTCSLVSKCPVLPNQSQWHLNIYPQSWLWILRLVRYLLASCPLHKNWFGHLGAWLSTKELEAHYGWYKRWSWLLCEAETSINWWYRDKVMLSIPNLRITYSSSIVINLYCRQIHYTELYPMLVLCCVLYCGWILFEYWYQTNPFIAVVLNQTTVNNIGRHIRIINITKQSKTLSIFMGWVVHNKDREVNRIYVCFCNSLPTSVAFCK